MGFQMTSGEGLPQRVNPGRRRQFNRGGEEVDYFVWIVCTDRGRHDRVLLTTARRELDGTRGMNFALRYFAPPWEDAESESGMAREAYTFRCPRCTRKPQIKADRWWAAVEALVRADLDDLDVSLL